MLRRIVHLLFIPLNLAAILLMVGAAYSDHISPHQNGLAPYLGLLFPFIVVLNIIILFYRLLTFRPIWALVGVVALVVCIGPIQRYIPFRLSDEATAAEATAQTDTETIKVLSYNVMNFAWQPHTERKPNLILQHIIESDADIVCLQEYQVQRSDTRLLTESSIRRALRMYPYRAVIPLSGPATAVTGLAVYSKYPILESRPIPYPSAHNGSAYHRLNINGRTLHLINNHLESFKLTTKDRTVYSDLVSTLDTDGLDEIRTTIRHKLGTAYRIRSRQAETIAAVVADIRKEAQQKGEEPLILLCGDFNDTPISYTLRTIGHGLEDAFVGAGRGVGITYHANFFRFRIDYVLHSAGFRPLSCNVVSVNYSDHYPLHATLQLADRK
jgi:endonuclease/exonuclease/phosphatase family metal-dependent hydrolase